MATLLNILWNVPGLGFIAAAVWALLGCVMAASIVGLPWAKACFMLASFTLAPFGRQLMSRRDVTGEAPAKRYDPSNPIADKDGNVFDAAVDETRELVDMMETARSYQNNVEVMNTAKSLIIDTLKMGR